jgi:ribose 5-phosphate isomerase A
MRAEQRSLHVVTEAEQDAAKKRAALAALAELPEAGVIGLGTGSTIRFAIEAIGELVRNGRKFEAVCTSAATRALASACAIPLLADDGPWPIEVTIDGADEVDDALCLSKGGGGALTREKIVSTASKRTVILCDASKLVRRLGETRPIAIEVVPFGHGETMLHLTRFGQPHLRSKVGGSSPAITDNGNFLIDLAIEPTDDPAALDCGLRFIPGVVETGLFIHRADIVFVAHADRVDRLVRSALNPRK